MVQKDFTIWILDTHTVWYSDESSIQMVTVLRSPLSKILFLIQVDLSEVSKDEAMGFRNEVKLLMKLKDKKRIVQVCPLCLN